MTVEEVLMWSYPLTYTFFWTWSRKYILYMLHQPKYQNMEMIITHTALSLPQSYPFYLMWCRRGMLMNCYMVTFIIHQFSDIWEWILGHLGHNKKLTNVTKKGSLKNQIDIGWANLTLYCTLEFHLFNSSLITTTWI